MDFSFFLHCCDGSCENIEPTFNLNKFRPVPRPPACAIIYYIRNNPLCPGQERVYANNEFGYFIALFSSSKLFSIQLEAIWRIYWFSMVSDGAHANKIIMGSCIVVWCEKGGSFSLGHIDTDYLQ